MPTAEALESYEWTAYGEVLGLAARGLVDPRTTLALLHPVEATAKDILRDAMASRVARWQAERAGIDPCEEPGCRGERDGCLLLHAKRRHREPADAPLAPSHIAWRPPEAISRAHDERMDRQARLRLAGWRPSDLVGPVCAHIGADPAAVLAGRRRPAECAARALIAYVACDGVGTPAVTVAELLGVSGATISLARVRGRALLASRGWSFEGCCRGAFGGGSGAACGRPLRTAWAGLRSDRERRAAGWGGGVIRCRGDGREEEEVDS